VLAFWGPWCTSCIKEFPAIDRLQKEFGDSMQIIMVNRDTKQRTEIFFKNRPQISIPFVPFITSDTVLSKFFEHTGVPYHVWIDSKGIIKHVSESYHLTEKNIRHFLLYNDLRIPDSKVYLERENLFDESLKSSIQYYSYISRCINENGLKLKGPTKNELSITSFDCSSIIDLYQLAFGGKSKKEYFNRPGRTILFGNNSEIYLRPKNYDELQYWFENNSYYYQLVLPAYCKMNKYDIMKEDLNRFFGFKARIEKREMSCLTLVRIGSLTKIKTKKSNIIDTFFPFTVSYTDSVKTPIRFYHNKPWADFSKRLSLFIENTLGIPFYEENIFNGNIDVEMNGDILDNLSIEGLRKELRKYNLDLIKKQFIVDVLVIKDKNQ
jgi:thiol-disulfide isomerase/thioredoxin